LPATTFLVAIVAGLGPLRPITKFGLNMTNKQSQVPLSTVASFAEHLTEMLDHLQDVPEFKKRHSASLIRLRDGIAKLLDN
jgi:hypothetical protein